MEELLDVHGFFSQLDRTENFKPIFKQYSRGELKAIGCCLAGSIGPRSYKSYGIAETEGVAFLKARNALIGKVLHESTIKNKNNLSVTAAFSQQNLAYDRALRGLLAQDLLIRSMAGAGSPIQFPIRETGLIWHYEDKYSFANYGLMMTKEPLAFSLVLAIAIPKDAVKLPIVMGVGAAASLEDSVKSAWNEVGEKIISEELFGEHDNSLAALDRLETMRPQEIDAWVNRVYGTPAALTMLDLDSLIKEILFADKDISVFRVQLSQ